MRHSTLIVLTLWASGLFGQNENIKLSIEYTPNFSKLTNNSPNHGLNFSHQFFGRVEFNITQRLGLSVGLGYLNARDKQTYPHDPTLGVKVVDLITNHDYVTIPLGLTYRMRSWLIRPEVGVGYNFSKPGRLQRQTVHMLNGERQITRWDHFNQREYNDITFPLFLSVVKEVRLSTYNLQFGAKGFYSLERVILESPFSRHYIGFGLLTGLRF